MDIDKIDQGSATVDTDGDVERMVSLTETGPKVNRANHESRTPPTTTSHRLPPSASEPSTTSMKAYPEKTDQ